ncbi:PadR family transcriptional regulator [Nonomuraea sp. NPDC050536]|uniref:PadR family transcriptional regulator n=1 Tax=Nonomuraea sp. NPDC050536 TaxID=3364366 RepID=UPI0037C7EE24
MSTTRILLLGVLLDEPMNGYRVRRRLEAMGADGWANVAFGSIYHGLSKMADEGLLEVVESGRGGKTVYQITEQGRLEFQRLLTLAWYQVQPIVDPFQVALSFMHLLPKEDLIGGLQARIDHQKRSIAAIDGIFGRKQQYGAPRHVDENLRLTIGMIAAQLAWAEQALKKVESGELP